MDFLANGNGKNKLGRKRQEQRPWLTCVRLGPLKAKVLVLYRLEDQPSQYFPSGPRKRESGGGKALILMQLCQCFHPRATDAQSPV